MPKKSETHTVPLTEPIDLGETKVETLTLRKPSAGDFRGLRMVDVGNADMDAYAVFLPRIVSPTITEQHFWQMDPADIVECMGKVDGWLAGK